MRALISGISGQDGTYLARVETERSSEVGDPQRLSLLPGGDVIVDYTDTRFPANHRKSLQLTTTSVQL